MNVITREMADKRAQFTLMLTEAINASPKSQSDIARAIGYESQNIVTMFKRGNTRVPLEKVAPLARELDLDPALMLRLWFETYMPEAYKDIEDFMHLMLTSDEKSWIRNLRRKFGEVPRFSHDRMKELIAA